jgi:anaerobic magnesium-protoporphyrin IX monomethyl ester cyclase
MGDEELSNMKISLVMCPIWNIEQPPLSIAYISGQLKSAGHEVFCHDFSITLLHSIPQYERDTLGQTYLPLGWYNDFKYWREKLLLDRLIDRWEHEVLKHKPKLVGFSIYDSTLSVSLLLAESIKKKSPETLIIFGGPSCDDKMIISRSLVDFLIYGEGEETITDLVERIENKRPFQDCLGIAYVDGDNIVQTSPRPLIANINSIPYPDFNEFNLSMYPSKALPMFTSRGCPNRCSFCSESQRWGRYRYRTAENIVDEMERNLKSYGITHFSMEDSTINGNMDEFDKMCELILFKKLPITWGGKARINPRMDPALIKKAYKAGCREIIFGIESGSQKVLDHMRKNIKISDVETVIINSFEAGIKIGCFFILGYVNETDADFEMTLNFIRRNHKYIHTVYPGNGLVILRGSHLYNHSGKYGIVLPEISPDGEWRTLDGSNNNKIRADRVERFNNLITQYWPTPELTLSNMNLLQKLWLKFKRMSSWRLSR